MNPDPAWYTLQHNSVIWPSAPDAELLHKIAYYAARALRYLEWLEAASAEGRGNGAREDDLSNSYREYLFSLRDALLIQLPTTDINFTIVAGLLRLITDDESIGENTGVRKQFEEFLAKRKALKKC